MATDQIVGQSRWIGWTIGVTAENLMGSQCGAVVGLHAKEGEFMSGERMAGVWYGTLEDSRAHQAAMDCASYGDLRRVSCITFEFTKIRQSRYMFNLLHSGSDDYSYKRAPIQAL